MPGPGGPGPGGSAPGGESAPGGGGCAWWRPPGTATAVGGTHPTGMHSCNIMMSCGIITRCLRMLCLMI